MYLKVEDLLVEIPSDLTRKKSHYYELTGNAVNIRKLPEDIAYHRSLWPSCIDGLFIESRIFEENMLFSARMAPIQGQFYGYGSTTGVVFQNFSRHGTLLFKDGRAPGRLVGIDGGPDRVAMEVGDQIHIGFPHGPRRYRITLVDKITVS